MIPSLDGLRALSITVVVLKHAGVPGPFSGSFGVTTFFFISGFLITTLLRREYERNGSISLGLFYLRRTLRIFPPLYVVLAIATLLSLTGILVNEMTGGGLVAGSTFLANYWIVFVGKDGLPGGMNVLWSLAVEEHYYLVFPVLYLAMLRWLPDRRRQVAVLVTICAIVLAWRCWLRLHGASDIRLYYATDTRVDGILWGAITAIAWNPVYGETPKWLATKRGAATATALGAGFAIWVISRLPGTIQYTVGYTAQALLLIAGVTAVVMAPQSLVGRFLNGKPVVWVGVISYSLYLVHRPMIYLVEEYVPGGWYITVPIVVVASVLMCVVLKRYVEDPSARLRKRLQDRALNRRVAGEATPAVQPARP